MIDPDGITKQTCRIAATERVAYTPAGQDAISVEYSGMLRMVRSFTLVEYGCRDGEEYEIRRQTLDLGSRGVQEDTVEVWIGRVNSDLSWLDRCDCIRGSTRRA